MRFRRVALAAMTAMLLLSTGATAAASVSGSAGAIGWTVRTSGNGCGTAEFNYDYYEANDDAYDISISHGRFSWRSSQSTCGAWGQPYAPVLQWKGEQYGRVVDWQLFRRAATSGAAEIENFGGSGFNNIKFRVCNWNTRTGTVGTCGSS